MDLLVWVVIAFPKAGKVPPRIQMWPDGTFVAYENEKEARKWAAQCNSESFKGFTYDVDRQVVQDDEYGKTWRF